MPMSNRKLRDLPGQLLLDERDENIYVRCQVCGRVLRRRASIAARIGARCSKKKKLREQTADCACNEKADRLE
jgi:hypothetical protein